MKCIFSLDGHVNLHLSDVFERKAFVEEPDKRAYGTACVVVFCFAEQERGSPFDVAQINIVSKRRSFNLACTGNDSGLFHDDIE